MILCFLKLSTHLILWELYCFLISAYNLYYYQICLWFSIYDSIGIQKNNLRFIFRMFLKNIIVYIRKKKLNGYFKQ